MNKLWRIAVSDTDKLEAPEWVVRNLAAHLDEWLGALAETKVCDRLAGVLESQEDRIDLSEATPAELRELLRAAESARTIVKPPMQWNDPISANEFLAAFDRLIELLHQDKRVNN